MSPTAQETMDLDMSCGGSSEINIERKTNDEEFKFDCIIGELESMLVEDEFSALQDEIFDKYCDEFDDTEENKLIYTDIFREYTEKLEAYMVSYLTNAFSWFSMADFSNICSQRKANTMEGDVFDVLRCLGDFNEFKELMLDYKRSKKGETQDLSGLLLANQYHN